MSFYNPWVFRLLGVMKSKIVQPRRLRARDAGCCDPERPTRTTKSNKMRTFQNRAVLHMALGQKYEEK